MTDNSGSSPPGETTSSPPRDLHPVSDIRFVIHEIGKLSAKVDRLIDDTGKNTTAIEENSRRLATFQTAAGVLTAAVAVIAVVFRWAFGDYVKLIVQDALRLALKQHS